MYMEVSENVLSRHTPGAIEENYETRQLIHLVPGSVSITAATEHLHPLGAPTIFAQCIRLHSCHNSRSAKRTFMKCDIGEFSSRLALLIALYSVAYRPVVRQRRRKKRENGRSYAADGPEQ
jgi:hypothetical protein